MHYKGIIKLCILPHWTISKSWWPAYWSTGVTWYWCYRPWWRHFLVEFKWYLVTGSLRALYTRWTLLSRAKWFIWTAALSAIFKWFSLTIRVIRGFLSANSFFVAQWGYRSWLPFCPATSASSRMSDIRCVHNSRLITLLSRSKLTRVRSRGTAWFSLQPAESLLLGSDGVMREKIKIFKSSFHIFPSSKIL